ncbi:hypothetical protein NQ314_003233 [Rhamnusium bicolor]|uniref:Wiskott-Aldrich syndrome protein family member n=1 Tax=Rhamnusium bicolor TaxID=1586634 RepID=A0AAV8ZM97_9CUCU|nr:hypothetical protein NQ314_003233 [Rhamnusium bicolor]
MSLTSSFSEFSRLRSFGELARDAQQLYDRSNSLQARIDRLAIKVTQLDSTVEEVSLQDIHMRKAFKSAVVFDQQIFSKTTMPTAMLETYNSCDKPPPLDKLNCYEMMNVLFTTPKFYCRTPQQLQQQPQMPPEELLVEQRPPRLNSIEIRRSYQQEVPDGLHSPTYPPYEENPYQHGLYGQGPLSSESLYAGGTPTRGGKIRPSQPPPAPPSNTSTPSANTPTRGRRQSSQSRSNSPHSHLATPEPIQDLPPPPPAPVKQASPPKQQTPVAPPPPPPPPMPLLTNGPITTTPMLNGDLAKILNSTPPKLTPVKDRPMAKPPMVDPRNDLLKAIRDGIKLRKVEKIEQKEVERGNGLHDVASILSEKGCSGV